MSDYLRPNQIEEMKTERDVLRRTIATRKFDDASHLERQREKLETELEAKTPPDLTGPALDATVKREQKLRKELLDFGMPSHEEMRKNPPGVVGRHMRWEKFAKERTPEYPKGRIFEWKQDRLVLNKGSDDPDQANFEQFRPTVNYGNLDNAQIPGTQYHGTNPSQEYLSNYDETFGKDETEEDLRAELAKLRQELEDANAPVDEVIALEIEKPGEPVSVTETCKCGKEFTKATLRGAKSAVRAHGRRCSSVQVAKE